MRVLERPLLDAHYPPSVARPPQYPATEDGQATAEDGSILPGRPLPKPSNLRSLQYSVESFLRYGSDGTGPDESPMLMEEVLFSF
ncbi:MAG: hypothetical protein V1930_09500 [Pseudomonadota bacterium]